MVLSILTCYYFHPGVGLSLDGVNYTNNSIVTRTDIGTGSAALLCTTTYSPCCTSGNIGTQWFFPDGSQVSNNGGLPYYRTRSISARAVLLNRNPEGTTTGIFRCDIPGPSGYTQSLYVTIYDGESCALYAGYHFRGVARIWRPRRHGVLSARKACGEKVSN